MNFKKGDRVKTVSSFNKVGCENNTGTILGYSAISYLVQFDKKIPGGYNGNPTIRGKSGHCWFLTDIYIELAEEYINLEL